MSTPPETPTTKPPSPAASSGFADEAADPRTWVPTRVLVVATIMLAVGLAVALVLVFLSWHTPAMAPIDIRVVPSA